MAARTQLVELVEDDDARSVPRGRRRQDAAAGSDPSPGPDTGPPGPPGPPGASAPTEPGDRARAWLRRHWRWLVPSAVIAVGALVATQGVVDAHQRARLARLAVLPGVLAPVDPQLSARWRGDASLGTALQAGTELGDRLLAVVEGAPDEPLAVVAFDRRTGGELWRTPVPRPDRLPGPADEVQQLFTSCSAAPHGTGQVALCTATQQAQTETQRPPTSLWVIDPKTGAVLARRTVAGTSSFTTAGPNLVVATAVAGSGSTRSWRIVASDLVAGTQRWTFTTPAVRITSPYGRPGGSPDDVLETPGLGTTPSGGILVTSDRHVWELSSTGTLGRSLELPQYSYVDNLRGGLLITSEYGAPSGARTGSIVLRDGTSVPTTDGSAYLTTDDGSAPGIAFTTTAGDTGLSGVTGRLVTTGAARWHHEGPIQAGLLLDGRLYLGQTDGVVALDARTGRELWRVDTDYSVQQIGTDGNALLVPAPVAGLTALSLASGQRLWTKRLGSEVAGPGNPAWTVQQLEVDGRFREVVGWNDDGSIVFLG
ncbi:outer membrane protein assembly factor BamB family protein [Cellulomonas alba]|uniref:PQQ-binding-like beta-propeller repeat protein n=1 Tax=Cellulomonas alba TaxID=3053467 RepID=A0ABT7SIL1_9CELL|nr:PQQ-binding-like beta-propeller repeat protein [Cellulomonas alba]MDM7855404.1 PQQ-binding-like beta-propeller repeat protein [Cellulomonas alba]